MDLQNCTMELQNFEFSSHFSMKYGTKNNLWFIENNFIGILWIDLFILHDSVIEHRLLSEIQVQKPGCDGLIFLPNDLFSDQSQKVSTYASLGSYMIYAETAFHLLEIFNEASTCNAGYSPLDRYKDKSHEFRANQVNFTGQHEQWKQMGLNYIWKLSHGCQTGIPVTDHDSKISMFLGEF